MLHHKPSQGLVYQIKKLGKHGAIYGIGSASSRLISFLMIPLYTHFLTPADYGVLQLVYLTTEVFSVIIGLRLAATVFRFYYEAEDLSERNTVISTALLGGGIAATVFLAPIFYLSSWLSGFVLAGKGQTALFQMALLSLWLQIPVNVVLSYIQVREKSILFVFISLSRLITSFALNVYFVAIIQIGVQGILLSGLIVDVVTFAVAMPLVVRSVGFRFSWEWFMKMLRFSLPLVPMSLASMVIHASDRYFVRGYLSLSDTGIYTFGYKIGNSIHSLLYVSFSQIWNARRFAIEKEATAPLIYSKIFTYFIGFTCFIGLGISIFSKDIVRIISSDKYWQASDIIPLVVLCYVIYAIEDHVSTAIYLKKKTERISLAYMIAAAANLCFNFLLIPRYGMYGAVFATLFSFILLNVTIFSLAQKLYPIPFEWLRISSIFLLCILLYFMSQYFSWLDFSWRCVINFSAWIAFPIVFWFLGLIKRDEKAALVYFSRRIMARFI